MTNNTIEIKLCVQNLGKYNEGELVFEWLTLPATDEEIQETLKNIGIDGVNYEEYTIADYEAPFHIGEYDSIDKWNNVAEKMEGIEVVDFESDSYNWDYTDNLDTIKSLANEFECDEVTGDYYTLEEIEDLELYPLQENGKVDLTRMYFFLGDIDGDTEVVRFDGYGNLKEVRRNELKELQLEVLESILDNI